ncbi:MAG: universal stress protein [Verrucomicrobiota bacterium]
MKALDESEMKPMAGQSALDSGSAAAATQHESPRPSPASVAVACRRLLVPMDLSIASFRVLPYAVRLAEQSGGMIYLMHVVDPGSFVNDLHNVPLVCSREEVISFATKLLSRLASHELPPARRGEILVSVGNPVREIAETATGLNVDLIVMSTHGYTRLKHLLLPSIAERVVRQRPCPVFTIREDLLTPDGNDSECLASVEWKNILVPVDFTEASRQALQYAVAIAGETKAKIILFHAVNFLQEVKETRPERSLGVIDLSRVRDELRQMVEHQLEAWAKGEIPRSIEYEKSVQVDAPAADVIGQAAKRLASDLIVMGNHHYSWWKHLGQADTAERVVRTAPCPVLSVPEVATSGGATPEHR